LVVTAGVFLYFTLFYTLGTCSYLYTDRQVKAAQNSV